MVYELKPSNGQKSFYGKAQVELNEHGMRTLYSYGTKIMSIDRYGEMARFWDGWTATTGKHIKAFSGLDKKGYSNLYLFNE